MGSFCFYFVRLVGDVQFLTWEEQIRVRTDRCPVRLVNFVDVGGVHVAVELLRNRAQAVSRNNRVAGGTRFQICANNHDSLLYSMVIVILISNELANPAHIGEGGRRRGSPTPAGAADTTHIGIGPGPRVRWGNRWIAHTAHIRVRRSPCTQIGAHAELHHHISFH